VRKRDKFQSIEINCINNTFKCIVNINVLELGIFKAWQNFFKHKAPVYSSHPACTKILPTQIKRINCHIIGKFAYILSDNLNIINRSHGVRLWKNRRHANTTSFNNIIVILKTWRCEYCMANLEVFLYSSFGERPRYQC